MEPIAADVSALARAPLFDGVPPDLLRATLSAAHLLELASGERLPEPEHGAECVYLVLSGAIGVFADANARLPLAVIGPGGCAGELAVLGDRGAGEPVIATGPARIAVFAVEALWQAMQKEPRIAYNLLRLLAQLVRVHNEEHLPVESTFTDRLTGLHNRRWMEEMFERELLRCGRNGLGAALLMIDVDRFRQINESVGRPGGDRLLARLGELLQRALRPSDLCARYGGGKFCVLLPEADASEARLGAERLRRRVEQKPLALSRDLLISCTVSIGVAGWHAGQSLENLVSAADSALGAAKDAGRNQVEVAAPALKTSDPRPSIG